MTPERFAEIRLRWHEYDGDGIEDYRVLEDLHACIAHIEAQQRTIEQLENTPPCHDCTMELNALQSAYNELQADKGRLDWMQAKVKKTIIRKRVMCKGESWLFDSGYIHSGEGDSLRQAIDNARSE